MNLVHSSSVAGMPSRLSNREDIESLVKGGPLVGGVVDSGGPLVGVAATATQC